MAPGPTTTDRAAAVIADHAASLLRIAQRHSLCPDDAQDAYQRTLVIYLERLDRVREATAGQWLRTVCKHEAMRIREQRGRVLSWDELDRDAQPPVDAGDPAERAAAVERVARAAEALQACKPDEATAMLLKADGSSYAEIGELTGWSRTKVNRSLAEGRARFLSRFAAIDSGDACAAWAPVLSAIVDGEATPEDFSAVRPHLRHCAACRASLRAMYEAEPALGALLPAGAVVLGAPPALGGVITRAYEALTAGVGERVARLHALVEAATSTKAAAVVASTAAVAAGGAAAAGRVEHAAAPVREARAAVPFRALAATPPGPPPAVVRSRVGRQDHRNPTRDRPRAAPTAAPTTTPVPPAPAAPRIAAAPRPTATPAAVEFAIESTARTVTAPTSRPADSRTGTAAFGFEE
jgi:RNA polymerase sigma factor (sigma-70 family)